LYNPESDLLLSRRDVWIRQRGVDRCWNVRSARVHGDALLLGLDAVPDRDAADELRGAEVCVPRSEFPRLRDDEVYQTDLIGLSVRSRDGEAVGEVVGLRSYPASECMLVHSETRDIEVPLIPPYLEAINLSEGSVTVAFLEDLESLPRGRA
jgi:16S rRNA processing protein RimM